MATQKLIVVKVIRVLEHNSYLNEIIDNLRETLGRLSYDTKKCSGCYNVVHEDETHFWDCCEDCGVNFCEECVEPEEDDARVYDEILCDECLRKYNGDLGVDKDVSYYQIIK